MIPVEPAWQPVGGEVRKRHDAQSAVAAGAGRQVGENQQRAVRRTRLAVQLNRVPVERAPLRQPQVQRSVENPSFPANARENRVRK